MTISNTSMKVTVNGTGSQITFNYGFIVPNKSNATLYLTDLTTGVITVLGQAAWSMTGAGSGTGGTFTYPLVGSGLPAITAQQQLTLARNVPATQPTNLVNQGAYSPQAVEGALDWIVMQMQQTADADNRALRVPQSEASIPELPAAALRKNTIQAYDSNGAPTNLAIQPDNNTTVIATGSTTARTLAARFAERKNVKDFGAVGNGTTDDTAAINAAVAALTAAGGGGVVYFPPGRYKTSGPIVITQSCVTLAGDALGQNNIGTQIIGSGNHNVIQATGVSFFTVQDIGVSHPSNGQVSVNSLILLTDCYYATIRHVSGRFYWNGITLAGSNQVSISDIEMLNNQALSGTSWGLGLIDSALANTFGVKLNDIRLQGVNDTAGSVGLYLGGAATVYGSQLVIRNFATAIYSGLGVLTAGRCTFLRFMQSEIETCVNGINMEAATRVTMMGVQVALSGTYGFRFATENAGDISLIGCMAVNNGTHGYWVDNVGVSGTFIFDGCKASGNSVVASNVSDGLLIQNSNNVTVSGGRYGGSGASSVPTTATQRTGIRVEGATCIGINVAGANLEGNVSGPLISGAAQAPNVIGCPGLGDAFTQVRQASNVNLVQFTSVDATFSPLVSAVGTDADINLRLSSKGSGAIVLNNPATLPVFTVTTLPAAGGSNLNAIIMVSNDVGGRVPAFSDGTNWRRVTDRNVIS